MHTRRAILPDATQIHDLIAMYVETGALLQRSLPELCENIRDFVVVEDDGGRILGCGALHLYGMHLAEVRSIAVHPDAKGKGAGRRVVKALLQEAARHQVTGVCLFTRIPEFFAKMGFTLASLEDLPDKIYKDCLKCPKLNACDEVAMLKGELPKGITILQQLRQAQRPVHPIAPKAGALGTPGKAGV
ncbi:MAG: N-acetyltransferase [Terriglobales bacterium]